MLALRVDSLKYDWRFTADNKEWAQKLLADYPNAEEIRKQQTGRSERLTRFFLTP